jgi:methylated-DNA-[protein]-cysteine S-methyltransferase
VQVGITPFDSPLGTLTLAAGPAGLVAIGFDGQRSRVEAFVRKRFAREELELVEEGDPAGAATALARYFAGELHAIDALPCDAGGTPFQREVWQALRRIPAGHTRSYGDLAREIERPDAVRAVGLANGANPIPIVIPCHRVIGADGTLVGYGGGLAVKEWLLAHEGARLQLG